MNRRQKLNQRRRRNRYKAKTAALAYYRQHGYTREQQALIDQGTPADWAVSFSPTPADFLAEYTFMERLQFSFSSTHLPRLQLPMHTLTGNGSSNPRTLSAALNIPRGSGQHVLTLPSERS